MSLPTYDEVVAAMEAYHAEVLRLKAENVMLTDRAALAEGRVQGVTEGLDWLRAQGCGLDGCLYVRRVRT